MTGVKLMPDSKFVDDAETEATLLALGPTLEWREVLNSFSGEEHEARMTDVVYSVVQYPDPNPTCRSFEAYRAMPTVDFCQPLFHSVVAAKAACERHYATGKWE